MHRSSESVAALATALAKAQGELTNPEKSLTATIWTTDQRGHAERSFRYAPLASGLDIIRKTLGRHELAVMQTTAIDQATGTVNLATILAHSSGEWMSSDWPVCLVADVAAPRRMGAALTYARRYALFTLVGIAGEDDLDAPDLNDLENPADQTEKKQAQKHPVIRKHPARPRLGNGSQGFLDKEHSAHLRNRLLSELVGATSHDSASTWARNSLQDKSKLTNEDLRDLENAFKEKLAAFKEVTDDPVQRAAMPTVSESETALLINKHHRHRDKLHLRFVASQPCLVCGRLPSDAHHLRFVRPRALGRKVSDEFTVPLCRTHHREVHRSADERAWWRAANIQVMKIARQLWKQTKSASESTYFSRENLAVN